MSGVWLKLEGDWLRRKLETIKLAVWPLPMKSPQKARKREMSKQAMREETERLVKEALERKTLTDTVPCPVMTQSGHRPVSNPVAWRV